MGSYTKDIHFSLLFRSNVHPQVVPYVNNNGRCDILILTETLTVANDIIAKM